MCHCNVLRLNKLPCTLLGTKQAVPAKQREVGALFGTVLKQKKSLPNKALTLRCFPATIMSPPDRVVRHIVFPRAFVCPSVCLSVCQSQIVSAL